MDYINKLLLEAGLNQQTTAYLSKIIVVLLIALLSISANFIAKWIVRRITRHFLTKKKSNWAEIVLKHKVFQRLSHLVPAMIIHSCASIFPNYQQMIEKSALCYMLIVGIMALNAFLNACDDIYRTYEVSKVKPIRGYIQVVKIFIFIIGGISLLANLIGQNPFILLSGLGALSAVLMLIFKDSILGLVAGVQLSTNDMVRVGDWIEMPKYNADGDVIDISLNTVKVKNWDKTITTIPSYALISDSFKNWRGMQETGGRRIKRAIYIDMSSISFCKKEMTEKFKKIHFLTAYIETKEQEIEEHNQSYSANPSFNVNSRQLTNIGTYRVYIQRYLENHPKIHKSLSLMVRQLEPGQNGLPLELYAFTSDIRWTAYEDIQADIFDHLLAIAPEFGLRVFQNPTGHDFHNMLKTSS